jgi:hypothetical protein
MHLFFQSYSTCLTLASQSRPSKAHCPNGGNTGAPLLERPTIRPKKFLTDPVSGQLSSPQGVVYVSLVIDEVSFHQHHISQLSGKQLPITSYEQ